MITNIQNGSTNMEKSSKIVGVMPLYCDEKESIWMLPAYMDMLADAGLLPIILPLRAGEAELAQLDGICDGYLFTGGHDVDPSMYGAVRTSECGASNAARDALESRLLLKALETDKPLLGICRGIQIINVVCGGTLYQDLPTEYASEVEHHMTPPYNRFVHEAKITGPVLGSILGEDCVGVNSYHHQAICHLAEGLQIEAVSEDGLIEAVSYPRKRFVLAVQWHPELIYREDENCAKIVRAFAAAL